MQAAEIVQEARDSLSGLPSEQALHLLTYQEDGTTEDEDGFDPHAALRALVLEEVQHGLSLKDRALIRFLLEQEIACRQNDTETEIESIHYGSFLLFLLGQLEDVELLWQAKRASFDTWGTLDMQLLVGAGVSSTLASLHSIKQEWAEEARTYLEKSQQAGFFRDLESYRNAKQWYLPTEPSLEESSTTEHPKSQ
jgi:hypothetical protein